MSPSAEAGKPAWRGWARAVWNELDVAEATGAIVAALSAWPGLSGTVLTYLAMPGEIDLDDLPRPREVTWAVTRTPPTGPLTVHWLGGHLERHPLGFLQPDADAPMVSVDEIDVVLVPGLAFDEAGGRLGRGKGYYDVLLASMSPRAMRVGIAPRCVIVPELPIAPHDVRMTHLATEEGVMVVAEPDSSVT